MNVATTTLARFIFPDVGLCAANALFVRTGGDAEYSQRDRSVRLGAGGVARFDTYFNAFSVGKWVRHSAVRHVGLRLHVSGHVRAELVHQRRHRSPQVVAVEEADVEAPAWMELALPPLDRLGDGAAYLRVTCLSGTATIDAGEWRTDDEPSRPVRLGMVITTFNRERQLGANLDRLQRAFGEDERQHDALRLAIVDNASNLGCRPAPGVPTVVIPNPNLGGAGGFARGLMHHRESGWATHVLFMDDDVSFDPEILHRTVQHLAFATDPKLCVAGAMLSDSTPTEIFEAGARFLPKSVYPLRAVNGGRDLLDWDDILAAEVDKPLDYGAWWYFAFPVDLTADNPMPMFLRGDDVCWGLLHAGAHTVTFGGIALWHEDFELKNGPAAWFYDLRNFAVTSVVAVDTYRWWHLLRRYLNICSRSLVSFKYTSAEQVTLAMEQFLAGPGPWLALDQAELHEAVRGIAGEAVGALGPAEMTMPELPPRPWPSKFLRAAFSAATLGGNLLPEWARRTRPGAVPLQHRILGEAAIRDEIVYRDRRRQLGFVARRDRRRFFTLFARMVVTSARIPIRFGRLRTEYRAAYPEMVSDEYWNRQFGRPGPDAAAERPPAEVGTATS